MSLFDLVPKKLFPYFLLFVLCSGGIAMLEYLHYIMPVCARFLGVSEIAAFDFRAGGNLSEWFSANLWTLSSIVCLLAFFMGRSQGKNHNYSSDIWIWGAFACLYLSVDSVCRIRDLISDIGVRLSGTPLYGEGQIWWISLYTVVFGMIGSRLLVEMRHYLPSCNAFFVGSICHILYVCMDLKLFSLPQSAEYDLMSQSGLQMTGNMFLFFSFALYVRHLAREAKRGATGKTTMFNSKETTTALSSVSSLSKDIVSNKTTRSRKRSNKTREVQIVHPSHQSSKSSLNTAMKPVEDEAVYKESDEEEEDDFSYEREREDEGEYREYWDYADDDVDEENEEEDGEEGDDTFFDEGEDSERDTTTRRKNRRGSRSSRRSNRKSRSRTL
ncbi:MAG: hypothetical protein ACRC10_07830 [Thermoguttaceae bacterium]